MEKIKLGKFKYFPENYDPGGSLAICSSVSDYIFFPGNKKLIGNHKFKESILGPAAMRANGDKP